MFALALLVLAGLLRPGGVPAGERPKLRCEWEAVSAAGVGQPPLARFRLVNVSERRVCVLRWYTPLEGLRGKILKVSRDGVELSYGGVMAKRGSPTREDYLCLAPGDSVSNDVDLSRSYDLTAPGRYEVRFVGRIHDFEWDESRIPRAADSHRRCEVDSVQVPLAFERR